MIDQGKVAAAIARIEKSRESHQRWVDHLSEPDHSCCDPLPAYIQTLDEHRQIVEEYDTVLEVLRSVEPEVVGG